MPVLPPLHADRTGAHSWQGRARTAGRDDFLIRIAFIVAAGVLILDQATKELVERVLVRGRMVAFLSEQVGWQLTYNDGAAFGLPAPWWFFLVVTVLVGVLAYRNLPHATTGLQAVAWGVLLGGAFGNAADRVFRTGDPGDPRFFHGHVVDFVAWGSYPRFNLADVAILTGFGLILIAMSREESAEDSPRAARHPSGTREPAR